MHNTNKKTVNLSNQSAVKVTYTFDTEYEMEKFIEAYYYIVKCSNFVIGELQVLEREKQIHLYTSFTTLCSIFYVMGAFGERDKETLLSFVFHEN